MELHDRTITTTTTTTRTIAVTPQTLCAKDVIDVMIVALSLSISAMMLKLYAENNEKNPLNDAKISSRDT